MSLNFVLKGEQYHITSKFLIRWNCSALPPSWMTGKYSCILTSLPICCLKTAGGWCQGKWWRLLFLVIHCDADPLPSFWWGHQCQAMIVQRYSGQTQRWLSHWAVQLHVDFFSDTSAATNLFPSLGNLTCTSQIEI